MSSKLRFAVTPLIIALFFHPWPTHAEVKIEEVIGELKRELYTARALMTEQPTVVVRNVEVEMAVANRANADGTVSAYALTAEGSVEKQHRNSLKLNFSLIDNPPISSPKMTDLVATILQIKRAIRTAKMNAPLLELNEATYEFQGSVSKSASGGIEFFLVSSEVSASVDTLLRVKVEFEVE
tara:strand:- start:13026 stop:13571 length:546 start_codon:yes stop_codon:yes gene_type:complete